MLPAHTFPLAAAVVLAAARLTPAIWLVAPLGGPRLAAPARVGLSLLLGLDAAPLLAASPAGAALAQLSPLPLALLLGRELLVGVCLGLVAAAAFRAAEAAGRLADTLRGASLAEVLVPTSDERASPLGALYLLLATLVFFEIGGVPRLIEALLGSYRALPLDGGLGAVSARRIATVVAAASGRVVASGLALAAPVVVALWLTDLALGLVARVAPQVPVHFVGLPLKGLLAVGVVLVGLGALEGALAGELAAGLRSLGQAIATFSG